MLDRRSFLSLSAASAGALALGPVAARAQEAVTASASAPPAPAAAARLRLTAQHHLLPGKSMAEKVEWSKKLGFDGIEILGGGLPGRVAEIQKALKDNPLPVSAICAGFQGWAIAENPKVRQQFVDSMKRQLEAAGAIGSTGVIWVPHFHGLKVLPHMDARKLLTGFNRWDRPKNHAAQADKAAGDEAAKRALPMLWELGDFAVAHKTRMLLEPLNRDETYFVRTLADGASICRDLAHPGLCMMADLWHMTWEEADDRGALLSAAKYVHHVHIASRKRRWMPGSDGAADDYVNAFRALKEIGYQDFVSFEHRRPGDPAKELPEAVKLLRGQWEKA